MTIVSRWTQRGSMIVAVVVVAAVAITINIVAAYDAQARNAKASDRFDLAREIPTSRFASLDEGRISASYWAAYVYQGPGDTGGSVPCAYLGAIDFVRPKVGFFNYAGECGALWPGEGARRPALGFLHQRSFFHGRARAEGMGLLLVAQSVRRVGLRFRGNSLVWASTKALSRSDRAQAQVPALRYATFAVHLDQCIRVVTAYDVSGNRVGLVRYPECHTKRSVSSPRPG
jgi:hypothetical protein